MRKDTEQSAPRETQSEIVLATPCTPEFARASGRRFELLIPDSPGCVDSNLLASTAKAMTTLL